MADLFISYSRRRWVVTSPSAGGAFVRELETGPEARGRDLWVDLEDIPPTAEWLAAIRSAIEAAHSIVYIISPHSISSEVCGKELTHAERHGKRLIPVLRSEVERNTVPKSLSVLNWIFAREHDDRDLAIGQIIEALDTDQNSGSARRWCVEQRTVGGARAGRAVSRDLFRPARLTSTQT